MAGIQRWEKLNAPDVEMDVSHVTKLIVLIVIHNSI